MNQCEVILAPVSSRKVKCLIPEHYLQNMDSLGLQQLEHLEKELEQAKKKQILVLKAQEHRETSSPDTKQVSESRYWTNEERQRFKKALKTFGTDFAAIAKFVGTRSSTQVRTHAQKYYAKLAKSHLPLIRDYKRSGKAGATSMKACEDATTRHTAP
nr:myb-like protein I isoform X1 [Physcomitrium patens]|eukprot:XP_024388371.1 myb-like protein I isoform X1 [Physcomitrella patens]